MLVYRRVIEYYTILFCHNTTTQIKLGIFLDPLFLAKPRWLPWDEFGIFTYVNGSFFMVNVGKYISPMDPMGN